MPVVCKGQCNEIPLGGGGTGREAADYSQCCEEQIDIGKGMSNNHSLWIKVLFCIELGTRSLVCIEGKGVFEADDVAPDTMQWVSMEDQCLMKAM